MGIAIIKTDFKESKQLFLKDESCLNSVNFIGRYETSTYNFRRLTKIYPQKPISTEKLKDIGIFDEPYLLYIGKRSNGICETFMLRGIEDIIIEYLNEDNKKYITYIEIISS